MKHIVQPVPSQNSTPVTASSAVERELVELWLSLKTSPHTRRAYAADIARLFAAMQKPLHRITLADLSAWRAELASGSLKAVSQNRALTAARSLFGFAHQTGYLALNPAAALKARPVRDGLASRILNEESVARLLAAAGSGRNHLLLRLLYGAGLRVSELCALRWRDVLAEAPQITVFGKGGQTRNIRLKSSLYEHLQALRGAPDAPVFQSRRGGALDASQVRRIVYEAARRAGLGKGVSPHWLRHAHATHALALNAPLPLVQATLGHRSIATTGRYLHARPTDSSSLYLPD